MEAIGFLDPVRSAPAARGGTWRIGGALSREADEADSDFSATLLAIAGHDLRQPLQVISSAHEVLGTMLRSVEQQHKLVQAADATARLTRMLGQLVEALQLRERPCEGLGFPVLVGPCRSRLNGFFTITKFKIRGGAERPRPASLNARASTRVFAP